MIITLLRTGGFTGIPLNKTIDTAHIPQQDAKEIEGLISQVDFSSLDQPKEAEGSPDRFTYSLSIQNEEMFQNIKVSESFLSQPCRELIGHLLAVKEK